MKKIYEQILKKEKTMYMEVYKDNFNILAFSTIYNDKSIISQNMEEKNR